MLHFTIYGVSIIHTDFEPQMLVRRKCVTHIQSHIKFDRLWFYKITASICVSVFSPLDLFVHLFRSSQDRLLDIEQTNKQTKKQQMDERKKHAESAENTIECRKQFTCKWQNKIKWQNTAHISGNRTKVCCVSIKNAFRFLSRPI